MVDEMTISTQSASETMKLGRELGMLLESGNLILLSGDLGAGKTTFSKGVGLGLKIADELTSPTFTIVAEYEGRVPLAHMDLYRLYSDANDPNATGLSEDTLVDIGFEDYLEGDYAVLIEWPEGVSLQLDDALHIHIKRAPMPRLDERILTCKATGKASWALLDEWVKRWLF